MSHCSRINGYKGVEHRMRLVVRMKPDADAFGHSVEMPAGLVWSVNSSTAGTVDSTGHFSAGSVAGSYTLTATSGTVAGHASILVVPGALVSIAVSPVMVTLEQGATQQFTAVGKDAHNNDVVITPVRSVVLGGTIDQNGLFTAASVAGPFTSTFTATSGSISGSASVTVNPGPLASIIVIRSTRSPSSAAACSTPLSVVTLRSTSC